MSPEDRTLLNRIADEVIALRAESKDTTRQLTQINEELTNTMSIPERVASLEQGNVEAVKLLKDLTAQSGERDERVRRLEKKWWRSLRVCIIWLTITLGVKLKPMRSCV